LSVIEHPKGKGVSYAEWKAEQEEGQVTQRSQIRGAINVAINLSITMTQFLGHMVDLGFIIDERGKHAKIKNIGDKRFVRFDSLGEGYSMEEIKKRVYAQTKPKYTGFPEQDSVDDIFEGDDPVAIMTYVPLFDSYKRALERVKEENKRIAHNIRMYYLIRKDVSHMRLYEDTVDLLCTHHLKTAQDVIDYQKEAMKQIDENYAERQKMYAYLRKAREKGDLVEADKARYNVGVYTMRLSKLRREVTTCDEVLERGGMIRENLRRIRENDYRGAYISHKSKNKDYER
jgi:hypothetical protein